MADLHEWIDVPDLRAGDKVVIGYNEVIVDWTTKLPTGDYQVFWSKSNGIHAGATTFLAVTSLQKVIE